MNSREFTKESSRDEWNEKSRLEGEGISNDMGAPVEM